MSEQEGLTPAEREFEEALAGLQPATPAIQQERLIYQAGFTAGAQKVRTWQGVTGVLAAAFVAAVFIQIHTPVLHTSDQTADRSISTPTAIPVEQSIHPDMQHSANSYSYLTLRNEVLQKGLAALPPPSAGSATDDPPLTVESLLGKDSRAQGAARVSPNHGSITPGGRS